MSSKILVCTQCGYIGSPSRGIKGNGAIEIILWLCFIIPGLIYSVWRSYSRHSVCPKCKGVNLIPTDSPRAQKIMEESGTKEETAKTIEIETKKNFKEEKRKRIVIVVAILVFFLLLIYLVD
jgi:Zn-finger nucleic acid-binding protein